MNNFVSGGILARQFAKENYLKVWSYVKPLIPFGGVIVATLTLTLTLKLLWFLGFHLHNLFRSHKKAYQPFPAPLSITLIVAWMICSMTCLGLISGFYFPEYNEAHARMLIPILEAYYNHNHANFSLSGYWWGTIYQSCLNNFWGGTADWEIEDYKLATFKSWSKKGLLAALPNISSFFPNFITNNFITNFITQFWPFNGYEPNIELVHIGHGYHRFGQRLLDNMLAPTLEYLLNEIESSSGCSLMFAPFILPAKLLWRGVCFGCANLSLRTIMDTIMESSTPSKVLLGGITLIAGTLVTRTSIQFWKWATDKTQNRNFSPPPRPHLPINAIQGQPIPSAPPQPMENGNNGNSQGTPIHQYFSFTPWRKTKEKQSRQQQHAQQQPALRSDSGAVTAGDDSQDPILQSSQNLSYSSSSS